MVEAFEGNKAETKTIPSINTSFMAAHHLTDVTIVAYAGMISDANQRAIEDAGLSFILGTNMPDVSYTVAQWRREHPGQDLPDGHVFAQAWPATEIQKARGRRDKTIYYQHLLPVPRRPRPPHPARDRRAGRQGRESHRRHQRMAPQY
jgi:hypothetical protein